jgi:hypothetical protein
MAPLWHSEFEIRRAYFCEVKGGGIGVGRHELHKVARAELKAVHVGCLV